MRPQAIGALLCLAACTGPPARPPSEVHEEAAELLRQGESARALALIEPGMRSADEVWRERFRLLRVQHLLASAKADEALAELGKPIPETPAFREIHARRLLRLGHASMAKGQYAAAEQALVESERASQQGGFEAVEAEAATLRAVCRLRQKQRAEAEALLERAIRLARRARDGYVESGALINLGAVRQSQFRYDEAASIFQRAAEVTEKQARAQYPFALVNLAVCLARLGEFEPALDAARRAIGLLEKTRALMPLQAALGEAGNTLLLKSQPAEALPYLERALEVAREARRPAEAALWAGNLASAHILLGRWDQAERFNDEAARMKRERAASSLVYNTVNAARIAMGRREPEKAETLFAEAIAASPEDPSVIWDSNAGMGELAFGRGDLAAASRHFEAALRTIEKTRAELLRAESKFTLLNRLIRFYRDYVAALLDAGRADEALAVADSSRTQLLEGAAGRANPSQFRGAAQRSGAVVLAYWLAPGRPVVWVVTGGAIVSVPLAATGEEIATLANSYRASIEQSLADPMRFRHPTGARLYQLLIAPVRKWLPNGSRAIVVPDGALHNLNFETLPIYDGAERYLVEDVTISVAPSVPAAARAPAPAGSLLVIGDPANGDPEFPRLRYAAREVDSIAARFGERAVVRRGADATPSAFRHAGPAGFAAIHFAAHATANRESPLDSALILAPQDGVYKLYARDLTAGSLNAELVTISACRGAGARVYSGEGLVGFVWALLRGGARNVVAGLWDVNDLSTALLMETMYSSLAAGARPETALREAKLKLLRSPGNFRKPYYWGPFQHYRASR